MGFGARYLMGFRLPLPAYCREPGKREVEEAAGSSVEEHAPEAATMLACRSFDHQGWLGAGPPSMLAFGHRLRWLTVLTGDQHPAFSF